MRKKYQKSNEALKQKQKPANQPCAVKHSVQELNGSRPRLALYRELIERFSSGYIDQLFPVRPLRYNQKDAANNVFKPYNCTAARCPQRVRLMQIRVHFVLKSLGGPSWSGHSGSSCPDVCWVSADPEAPVAAKTHYVTWWRCKFWRALREICAKLFFFMGAPFFPP